MRLTNYGVDVAQWRGLRRNHMDIDAEAIGVETNWLLNALCAVDRVERRVGMENDLAILVDRVLTGTEQLIDIGLLNGVTAELDLHIGDVTHESASTVARPHVLNCEPGH